MYLFYYSIYYFHPRGDLPARKFVFSLVPISKFPTVLLNEEKKKTLWGAHLICLSLGE